MVKKGIKPTDIRVRIAPSPTGFLHIGTARTALFNYLFAKKYGGSFIVRIEDTDLERSDPKFERDILEGLRWLDLEWDEGPAPFSLSENGEFLISKSKFLNHKEIQNYKGNYEPYRQSERLEIYAKYLKKLLDEKKAYYCFCAEEELEIRRQEMISMGAAPRYSGKCADISRKEAEKLIAEGKPSIIRFRMPIKKASFQDLIHGKIEFDTELIGDIAIAKDLKTPLYNFAVIIDDFEMKISHIIRGEDHISNTPKQLMIQEALGFPQPEYAHIPLTLGPDKTKLSKRHGATSISEYREQGYLPESLINFMAFLGWNPEDEREVFSLEELTREFEIEKMNKSPAIFNIEKLDWYNGYYIRKKMLDELTVLCIPYLEKTGLIVQEAVSEATVRSAGSKTHIRSPQRACAVPLSASPPPPLVEGDHAGEACERVFSPADLAKIKFRILKTNDIVSFDWLEKVVSLERERMKKLSEVGELTEFFFKDKLEYDKELLRWKNMTDNEIKEVLEKLEKILGEIPEGEWRKEKLREILMPEAEKLGDKGKMLWPLRAALTGRKASPGPFEVAEALGREKTIRRINVAIKLFRE